MIPVFELKVLSVFKTSINSTCNSVNILYVIIVFSFFFTIITIDLLKSENKINDDIFTFATWDNYSLEIRKFQMTLTSPPALSVYRDSSSVISLLNIRRSSYCMYIKSSVGNFWHWSPYENLISVIQKAWARAWEYRHMWLPNPKNLAYLKLIQSWNIYLRNVLSHLRISIVR